MNTPRMFTALAVAALLPCLAAAHEEDPDEIVVPTTVDYLTGAAESCKVAASDSKALNTAIVLAIGKGKYGDPAQARNLLNNARKKGATAAAAREVDCAAIARSVQLYARHFSN